MKCVYGVIHTDEPLEFNVKPVGGIGPVQTAVADGLALVVSSVGEPKIRPSRRNMLAHTMVLEKVMESHDVLPMRFGLIIEDVEDAKKLLKDHRDVISKRLDDVSGHVEFGVKAIWDQKLLFDRILQERDDLREMRQELAGRPAQETYYQRIEIGRALETAVQGENDRLLAEAHPVFDKLATDSVINERKDQMTAIDTAYLVRRDDQDEFERLIDQQFADAGEELQVKLVGPVPPFNFVNLSIDWSI